mmetsp:Transcript_4661/g.6832  ORF Transcript_4661/g.6832 Transcript_4661/m.6832 type:complete len:400 (+) Transcript_4661:17-1216(+)
MASKTPSPRKKKISYPYKVDYNDHFETPLNAYKDILPMLDAVAPCDSSDIKLSSKKKKRRRLKQGHQEEGDLNSAATSTTNCSSSSASQATKDISSHSRESINTTRSNHVIYDPYFCNGRTKLLLQSIGFSKVQHEKRDFYKDIIQKSIPSYDTLITNPPYSEDHKEKCMQFAINQLRPKQTGKMNDNTHKKKDDTKSSTNDHQGKPFFILMPNYCACRNHYRSSIMQNATSKNKNAMNDDSEPLDIMYVVPSKPYEYDHPEGTGKDIAPFASIWYCGIPLDKVDAVKEAFRRAYGTESVGLPVKSRSGKKRQGKHGSMTMPPRLVSNLAELKRLNAVPTVKRPNPRQRKKARMTKAKDLMLNPNTLRGIKLDFCQQKAQNVGNKSKINQKASSKRKRK